MVTRKRSSTTTSALFGVAAIQAVVGFLGWFLYSPHFGPLEWLTTLSFAIYLGLAVWARWRPIAPACIGVVLYLAFLALQAARSMDLLLTGLIFKVPVVLLLIVALVSALRSRDRVARVAARQAAE